MKKSRACGRIVLKDGSFLLCYSLTSQTLEELKIALTAIEEDQPDMLEWRADYFRENLSEISLREGLMMIKEQYPEIPLIFTLRNQKEGGVSKLSEEEIFYYRSIAAESRLVDLMDIELTSIKSGREGNHHYEELLRALREKGVLLILSYHDFCEVPEKEVLQHFFRDALAKGADIAKIAVNVMKHEDLLILKELSQWLRSEYEIPHILIGMGDMGKTTRYSRKEFHSAVTYTYVGDSSAPGQYSREELRQLLRGE